MTQVLARYHSRSPRYILQTQDNTLIRVAGPHQTPWEEGTEIVNISLSGLAFIAPVDLCPIVGEFIKIQFQVPGNQEMACYGLVTRLEPSGNADMVVGIQFHRLEMPHRIVLLQGLAQKLKEQQKAQADLNLQTSAWTWLRNRKTIFAGLLLMVAWLGLLLWAWG
jgi:hypothetical protein